MAESGVSSPVLAFLMKVLPQPLKGDTNDFIRACVVLISPLVFTIGMYISMFDQPDLHSSLLHVILTNLLPVVMIVTKSYRIPGAIFVAMQYFFSFQMMESLGSEYGYTTPAFFLPLAATLLVNRGAGLLCALISFYMVLFVPYGLLPFFSLTGAPMIAPFCAEDCLSEIAFRGVLRNMFVIVAIGLVYSWLNDVAVLRLQYMNRLSQQFFAVICHELRGPCQSIVNGTRMLASGSNLTEDQQQLATAIDLSGQALHALLNDVLDFEKIEQGELQLDPSPVLLRPLVEGVVEMAALAAPQRPVELLCHLPRNLPVAVRADDLRLRQVFMNLIGNALKFTENGAVIVTVTKEREVATSVMLRVDVRDTGVGIAREEQSKLFQPFTTIIREETAKRYAGTGLGLSICKKLVHMMKGDVWVTSEKGKGSTFSFTVDLVKADSSEVVRRARTDSAESAKGGRLDLKHQLPDVPVGPVDDHPLHGARIIVATGNEFAQEHVRLMCQESHCFVETSLLPSDLIASLTKRFDVVLISQDMLKKCAQPVLEALRRNPGMRVVRIVRNASSVNELPPPHIDVCYNIIKPMTPSKLVSALLHAVSGQPPVFTFDAPILEEHPHASLTRMPISASVLQPQFYSRHNSVSTHSSSLSQGSQARMYARRHSLPNTTNLQPQQPTSRRHSYAAPQTFETYDNSSRRHSIATTSPSYSRRESMVSMMSQERTQPPMHVLPSYHSQPVSHAATPLLGHSAPLPTPEQIRVGLSSLTIRRQSEADAGAESTTTDHSDAFGSRRPPRPSNVASSPPQTSPKHAVTVAVSPLSQVRVLVVDDTATARLITSMMVKKLGVKQVDSASNGGEAISKAVGGLFDVIFLDMHLPDMSGLDVTKHLRNTDFSVSGPQGGGDGSVDDDGTFMRRAPRIIGLSGDAEVQEAALEAGMDICLLKPATQEQIRDAIMDCMRR